MKVICDFSVTSAPIRSRSWSPAALFAGGAPGLLMDATRNAVLFDAPTGSGASSTGSLPVGRAEDQSGNSRHLEQAMVNLRPLSIRAPMTGLRNRLAISALGTAQYSQKGGAMSDAAGFAGADQSVSVPDNGTVYGYFNAVLPPASSGTFSVFVQMDDNAPPAFGPGSPNGNANTLLLRANGENTEPLTYSVSDMGGEVYRIAVPITGIGASSFGFIRYLSHQQRGFKITGYQLETGGMSAYQHVTNGGLDAYEIGSKHLVGLNFDGIDDTLSASLPQGLNGEAFVAGRGASHAFSVTIAPSGNFTFGPLGFTGSVANALLTVAGSGTVTGPMLTGVVLRSGTFDAGEKNALIDYFVARGAGPYQETL